MAVNFRRVAQWSSAISVLLLITFMAVLPGTYEKMEPMLDPEQQNMARLEAGESASVDFVGGHVYVALRVNEGGDAPAAELRLLDEENQEFSGDSPTRIHVERLVNGTSYAPVRVWCFPNGCDSNTYTLHNEGDSVLWLSVGVAESCVYLMKVLQISSLSIKITTDLWGLSHTAVGGRESRRIFVVLFKLFARCRASQCSTLASFMSKTFFPN